MKKNIIFLILFSLLLSIFSGGIGFAQEASAAETLKSLGVLQGNLQGDLMLDEYLKRQDMVILISRLYKEETQAAAYLLPAKFTDLDESNSFYHGYIQWSVDKNLIIGMADGSFGFGKNVKVQDFQVVLLRALGYTEESGLYQSVPDIAEKLGIMNELEINAGDYLKRKDMAQMILNALRLNKKGSAVTLAEVLQLQLL